MQETRWWKYVTELIGDDSYKDAAQKAGFDKSAFSRWKRGSKADPEFVVKLARAYKADVLRALVEASFITEVEARFVREKPRPDESAVLHALQQLKSQLESAEGVIGSMVEEKKRISRIRLASVPDQPEAEPDVRSLDYAADRRTPEPEEGDDDYGPGA